MKKILRIVELITVILILISIIYSIGRVKVIINSNERYMLKKGDNVNIQPIGNLEIVEITIDEIKVNVNGDIITYEYNKEYKIGQKIPSSTDTNGGTITSIALKTNVLFEKCNIYIPVTITGVLIILICTVIIKTNKPKGEN